MKKFLTFSNFMVLLGIMTIFFYFIPAVKIAPHDYAQNAINVNLFQATFGGPFSIHYLLVTKAYHLNACGGLIVGFILGLVGILLTCAKMKVKIANLFALPFYTAAGVLVICTAALVRNANANNGIPNYFSYTILGGAITVGVFFFILAFLALVDFIATVAKPKQQQPSAY